jgi:hypothetical protein
VKRKSLFTAVIVLLLVATLSIFAVVWGKFFNQKPQAFTPHYMVYDGAESRIYAVSEVTNQAIADQNYFAYDGSLVSQGSGIFLINITLRNDYSSDNPPPAAGTPVSPIDGTVYLSLKAALFDGDIPISTINLSPSQFYPGSVDETGVVLASGQTGNFQLALATNQTNITAYKVNIESLTDSILR